MLITEPILAALMERYGTSLYYICLRIVKRTDVAEDAVMETFEKVWEFRDKFEATTNVKAFLYIAAKNLCRTKRERLDMIMERDIDMRQLQTDDPAVASANRDILMRAYKIVQRLGVKKAEVFYKIYIQGLPSKEVGAVMGINDSTVRSMCERFVIKIRREIA